jgi:hypothetical protein
MEKKGMKSSTGIMIAFAALLGLLLLGCSSTQKKSGTTPPAKQSTQGQAQKSQPGKTGNGMDTPELQSTDLDNRPLPVLPLDPPPPPGAEDLSDDNWARDQKTTKLKDKDKDRVKNSSPEDDNWGKD